MEIILQFLVTVPILVIVICGNGVGEGVGVFDGVGVGVLVGVGVFVGVGDGVVNATANKCLTSTLF
jgi:hypothetical protein